MSKNKLEEVWNSGPIGRVVVTLFLLPLGPLGWLCIAIMWGIYFFSDKGSSD